MKEMTQTDIEAWATDSTGPAALHLKQKLTSVECITADDPCIIYPPTYADIGYNIDTIAGGKQVALVDSVGSQANRMEPTFICAGDDQCEPLVPQIKVRINQDTIVSLLELAHRGADAVVRSSGELAEKVDAAFQELRKTGNAGPLGKLAPTSLLFGVWDSRGSNEKLPRLVRSIIRAWDVDILHAAAQYNSVWKALDEEQRKSLQTEAKKQKKKLSEKGFADAPSIFRDAKVRNFVEDMPNPAARILGGVLVHGDIVRDTTINLVALRGLNAGEEKETKILRTYLLGLALKAATAEFDLFLREGCNLRLKDEGKWHVVHRKGDPEPVSIDPAIIDSVTKATASHFRSKWPEKTEYTFDVAAAKKLLAAKEADDQPVE
jgi:CRISPR-associated protein Csb1